MGRKINVLTLSLVFILVLQNIIPITSSADKRVDILAPSEPLNMD